MSAFAHVFSGTEQIPAYRKMLRSVSCSRQFLFLEVLTRVDLGNCRPMTIPLLKSSELLCCTLLQIPGRRTFHTNFFQRQLKQKDSERHNTLIEAKDKPFSELTTAEKGENVRIKGVLNKLHIHFIIFVSYMNCALTFL